MAKSILSTTNKTRKVRESVFKKFSAGALKNITIGIFRGFGTALGISGVAVAVFFLSGLIAKIPAVANILAVFGISL